MSAASVTAMTSGTQCREIVCKTGLKSLVAFDRSAQSKRKPLKPGSGDLDGDALPMPRAVTLITASPGKVDDVAAGVRVVRGVMDVLTVAGRADVAVVFEGSSEEIPKILGGIQKVRGVQTTETLVELTE